MGGLLTSTTTGRVPRVACGSTSPAEIRRRTGREPTNHPLPPPSHVSRTHLFIYLRPFLVHFVVIISHFCIRVPYSVQVVNVPSYVNTAH